jgi:hypothetical protein
MKKQFFKTENGTEGLLVDCDTYTAEILKSPDTTHGFGRAIHFKDKKTGTTKTTPFVFKISWDREEDGGKIELKWRDCWGSEMIFIHFHPTHIKTMFDFIGRGYGVLNENFPEK